MARQASWPCVWSTFACEQRCTRAGAGLKRCLIWRSVLSTVLPTECRLLISCCRWWSDLSKWEHIFPPAHVHMRRLPCKGMQMDQSYTMGCSALPFPPRRSLVQRVVLSADAITAGFAGVDSVDGFAGTGISTRPGPRSCSACSLYSVRSTHRDVVETYCLTFRCFACSSSKGANVYTPGLISFSSQFQCVNSPPQIPTMPAVNGASHLALIVTASDAIT